jgi:hypothetical protein
MGGKGFDDCGQRRPPLLLDESDRGGWEGFIADPGSLRAPVWRGDRRFRSARLTLRGRRAVGWGVVRGAVALGQGVEAVGKLLAGLVAAPGVAFKGAGENRFNTLRSWAHRGDLPFECA